MTDVRTTRSLAANRLVTEAGGPLLRGPFGPDRRHWIIRPDDLVVLDLALENLKIVPGADGKPARLERSGPGTAYLLVTLPPQHLIEVAYFTTDENYPVSKPDQNKPGEGDPDAGTTKKDDEELGTPPIDARLAGWSTLAFIVRDENLPIDWTLEAVLKKIPELELNVAANALPPRDPPLWFDTLLVGMLQPAELAGIGVLDAAAGIVGASARVSEVLSVVASEAPAGSRFRIGSPGAARGLGPRSIRGPARDLRAIRTVGHVLGLSDATGSDTSVTFDQLAGNLAEVGPIVALARPEPRAPGDRETSLELPWRIILSPNRHGAWFHTETAATSEATGHTELWHTRLGVRREDGTLVDGPDPLRTVRAIWTTQKPPPSTPAPGAPVVNAPHDNDDPFRASLDPFDRVQVVHLSSNFQLRQWDNKDRYFEPSALDVDLLALTSLGGWLDSRGVWDDQPLGLSIEEWRHRATLGRDHYVRVVYAGRLFPLGHRASLVKITERRFEEGEDGHPAYLRQRMFLIVREPVRTYRQSGLTYQGTDSNRKDEQWDLMLPFTAARITTKVSPLLDPPETGEVQTGMKQGAFWPWVGGKPFRFHIVATDMAGAPVEMEMPLIFVGQEQGDLSYEAGIVPTAVATQYATAIWPDTGELLATVPLGGQKVAFATSATPDDTAFAVQSITFGGEVPIATKYNAMNARQPRYVPVVRRSQLDVPALQQIAQTDQPATLAYDRAYLLHGFGSGNPGEVFLAADTTAPKLGVAFSSRSSRSGGLVAPDMSLSGLSRITGPLSGSTALAATGTFDPKEWFGAITEARLFGALKLSDIIDVSPFSHLDELPKFVGDSLDQVQRVVADMERLRLLLEPENVPAASTVELFLDQLVHPSTGAISALLSGTGDLNDVDDKLLALTAALDKLEDDLPAANLADGPKAVLIEAVHSLFTTLPAIDLGLLGRFAKGDVLPERFAARFDWRPVLKPTSVFKPTGTRNLILSVEASGESLTVTCSLDHFTLDLAVLILDFERVQFRSRAGRKPEIDVKFTGFEFAGPLSFIETLRDLVPFDGFSDPPDIRVTPEGISAGFSTGLPNIAVGVFSLENLSLAAGFTVPFVGPPMSTWFRFCERENPSRLTVSLFGGGFFFGITVDASGLQVVEGAIEFGAAISVNFGVASGSVSAMAGLYFKIEGSAVTLAGYFRLRGEVEALGIISVCIELYLEMRYEDGGGKSGKCVGTATISVEIEVALFSTTIKITATKKFAGSGSGSDPTLAETLNLTPAMTSTDWNEYCEAFAA